MDKLKVAKETYKKHSPKPYEHEGQVGYYKDYYIHEFWYLDQYDIYQVVFVSVSPNGFGDYFDSSSTFLAYLQNLNYVEGSKLVLFKLVIGAIVWIGAACVMGYLAITQHADTKVVLTALAGLIASGATLFFGRWISKS